MAVTFAAPHAQEPASTADRSPHQRRTVTVDTSVRLEVLEWGGTGRPLLFVGSYLSAHVFDDIAPKLRDTFHVYAVTRRGIGASDRVNLAAFRGKPVPVRFPPAQSTGPSRSTSR